MKPSSQMPKPKPPVLTPEQKAQAIDQRNKEARLARRLGIPGLMQPKPKGGAR